MNSGTKLALSAENFDNLWASLREDNNEWDAPFAAGDEPDYETEAAQSSLDTETTDRVNHLNTLVMARLQGSNALFSLLQDVSHPAWVRVRAVREMAKCEPDTVTSPYYALLERLRESSEGRKEARQTANAGAGWNEMTAWLQNNVARVLPGVGACRLDGNGDSGNIINGLQEDGVDHPLMAECVAQSKENGYTLGVNIRDEVNENTLVHVVLFDRESGATFKHAAAPVEKRADSLFHADLFDREKLSRAELEHADALFWIERASEDVTGQ
jgi:hypothetical protein